MWKRVVLLFLGWLLVLLGFVALVVPVLQGWIVLLAAAAVLSLVSEVVYESLRAAFGRWPRGWRRVHKMRRWVHRRLHRE